MNPAFFSSNNTPTDDRDDGEEDDDEQEEEMDSFRLPSPARETKPPPVDTPAGADDSNNMDDDDFDPLAAEMEAAFEESALEEQVARPQYTQTSTLARYNVPSDDESEVSEEE